jgi:hypothetical protein
MLTLQPVSLEKAFTWPTAVFAERPSLFKRYCFRHELFLLPSFCSSSRTPCFVAKTLARIRPYWKWCKKRYHALQERNKFSKFPWNTLPLSSNFLFCSFDAYITKLYVHTYTHIHHHTEVMRVPVEQANLIQKRQGPTQLLILVMSSTKNFLYIFGQLLVHIWPVTNKSHNRKLERNYSPPKRATVCSCKIIAVAA